MMEKVFQLCSSFGGFVPVFAKLVEDYIKHLRGSQGRFVPVFQLFSKLVVDKINTGIRPLPPLPPISGKTGTLEQITVKTLWIGA